MAGSRCNIVVVGGHVKSMAKTNRLIGALAPLLALGSAGQVNAQLGVGTTWLRTDAQGKGITLQLRPVVAEDFVSYGRYRRWAIGQRI